ncbi:ferric reductase-like transmembrane domain-containing protein [Tateyamaria sp.]|uniref:ferric reductase-like transmembrane domain-containing protein n=1 Tax=Tateyamaria sp. TaxID=1929288 RepID=UPI00329E35BE
MRPLSYWLKALIWVALALAVAIPLAAAALSPQLAWRDPIYIIAGFAGIFAMALLLVQPLLAGGHLPALSAMRARRFHRVIGATLVVAIIVHVGALWITSPPDVIDALLLASPTPFSIWGVLAMWAVFAAALVPILRKRMPVRTWRLVHMALVCIVAAGTVAHALLIQGTMGTFSKIGLSILVVAATAKVVVDRRIWTLLRRSRRD